MDSRLREPEENESSLLSPQNKVDRTKTCTAQTQARFLFPEFGKNGRPASPELKMKEQNRVLIREHNLTEK